MSTNKLTHLVFIGRFSPIHIAHLGVIREALTHADKLIICIGSAFSPRTIKNPWTAEERMNMIRSALTPEENERIHFQYIPDMLYQNEEWATNVRAAVRAVITDYYSLTKAKIGLVIAEKDDTSWYVNLFPDWPKVVVNLNGAEDSLPIGATKVRELLFTGYIAFIKNIVPDSVFDIIKEFTKTEEFVNLKKEYEDGIAYEKLYENHPKGHSINFYTVDSVVFQSGCVLLVKRKHNPGKGLWALPGGHVNPNEDAFEAALRELDEETNIKIPRKVLVGSLMCEKRFDHPDRSMRARITKKNARTVDMAFGFKLDSTQGLPHVKGGDDAEQAWWFPIEEIRHMRDQLFEDHASIIDYFAAKL